MCFYFFEFIINNVIEVGCAESDVGNEAFDSTESRDFVEVLRIYVFDCEFKLLGIEVGRLSGDGVVGGEAEEVVFALFEL